MSMTDRFLAKLQALMLCLRHGSAAAAVLFPVLAMSLSAAMPAAAQDVQFSGDVEMLLGQAFPYTEEPWNTVAALLKANGALDVFANEYTVHLSGGLVLDALHSQSTDDKLALTDDDGYVLARIKEAYLDYNGDQWSVRAGRQISAWGKADGLTVTDILCPKDMSSLFASDYSDSSLGIDALRVSLNLTSFVCDAYWIPTFTPNTLPLAKGNPLRKILLPSSVSANGYTLDIRLGELEKPEPSLKNMEYAIKAAAYLPFADFSVYGFYGWDDTPVMNYTLLYLDRDGNSLDLSNPMNYLRIAGYGLNVGGEYKQMGMIGADAAIPAGPVTLRLEGAFFPMRHFATTAESQLTAMFQGKRAKTSVQRNQLTALAGIDWMPGGWTVTAQYYMDFVFGDLGLVDREQAFQHKTTLSVSRSFFGGNLEVSLQGLLGLNDFDSAIMPSVKYALSDQISLSLGGNFFIPGPDKDGEYGAYKDLSCLTFSGKFSF